MKFASCIALASTLCSCSWLRADQTLDELQGTWRVASVHYDQKAIDTTSHLTRFKVVGTQITSIEPQGPFTEFSEIGQGIQIMTDGQAGQSLYESQQEFAKQRGNSQPWKSSCGKQILVHTTGFGLIGLYRFQGNGDLELALKYLGQGIEGKHWSTWRPPDDFSRAADQNRLHVVLTPTGE